MELSRRHLLGASAACVMVAALPRLAFAGLPGDRRLVLIILRGGMDGLHAVPPVGDPDYAAARGGLALSKTDGVIDLDGTFALHPALGPVADLWKKRELAVVHAVASSYRERSHFDGQDILEGGGVRPHGTADGWLNRALGVINAGPRDALAVSQNIPLVLRGAVQTASWAPSPLPGLSPELTAKLSKLYENDSLLAMAFEDGVQAETFAHDALADGAEMGADGSSEAPPAKKKGGGNTFAKLAEAAGRMLATPDGPKVAVLELGGWDTHTGQLTRMAAPLGQLAEGIAALCRTLGPAWGKTVVVATSEFGRTVAMNGTAGSDHGTAGAVFLAGGAIAGGQVFGRWPGLSKDRLWQGRDLMPTTDLRSLFKGILRDHLRLSPATLDSTVFPESLGVGPLEGMVRGA